VIQISWQMWFFLFLAVVAAAMVIVAVAFRMYDNPRARGVALGAGTAFLIGLHPRVHGRLRQR
jgi:hypothetical protein